MAGNFKPSPEMIESNSQIISSSFRATNNGGRGLFDGKSSNNWNTADVAYWETTGHYIEIYLESKSNLWRTGTSSTTWINYISNFKIMYKQNLNDTYIDVTNSYVQTNERVDHNTWNKSISNLEPGYYKFSIPSTNPKRLDSEWFFEKVNNYIYLLKNNNTNKYYTIKNNNVEEVTDLSINNLLLNAILPGTDINLIQLSTFNDLIGTNFEVVCFSILDITPEVELNVNVIGRRESESSLISILGIETLNEINILGSGDVKTVISFDNGNTWKKYDGSTWIEVVNAETGMTINEVNSLTANIFTDEIINVNSIKLKHSFDYISTIDNIEIKCNMIGEQIIAEQNANIYNYNYDMTTQTITFNILKNGIYSVNYLDSK